ncbi:virulence factor [Flavobacteriaceae bacterium Ap0902]|nr:virulence factor [Flavobacteriaceae bacterium Ap0902]
MYAVLFDLDTNCLNEHEGNTYHNSYKLIKDFMINNGFEWKQGSVYFGGSSIDAVTCVLTIQRLAKTYPWFSACVKDVRMLRIEENNDLLPAISLTP